MSFIKRITYIEGDVRDDDLDMCLEMNVDFDVFSPENDDNDYEIEINSVEIDLSEEGNFFKVDEKFVTKKMENRIKKLIYEILFVDEIVEIFEEPDE
jgi:hypothetical protein